MAALNSVDEASTYREQAAATSEPSLDDRLSSFLAAVPGAECSVGKKSADDRLSSFLAAVPGASCTAERSTGMGSFPGPVPGASSTAEGSLGKPGGSVLGPTHRTVTKATARPGNAARV